MKKFILGFIMFLSISILTGGLVFIYSEFYSSQKIDTISLSNEKQEFDDTEEFIAEADSDSDSEGDAEIVDDIAEKDIDNTAEESEHNQEDEEREEIEEPIVESSDKINSDLRDYELDRINTFEDYVPIIPLNEINDKLIGANIKVVGELKANEDYKDGQLGIVENDDTSVRIYYKNYTYYGYSNVTSTGILSKDSSGYLITSNRLYNFKQRSNPTFEEGESYYDAGVKGQIVQKILYPEGHIKLVLHDQNRKEFEVNIPNLYNPIPNHYSKDDYIIVKEVNPTNNSNRIDVKSLRSIEKIHGDENTRVHDFVAQDIKKDNWGQYGVINAKVKDMNVYSDNTVYMILENNNQIFHGTILKQDNGISDKMENRIHKIENAMSNDQEIQLFGLVNYYNDAEEFIIIDAYHK